MVAMAGYNLSVADETPQFGLGDSFEKDGSIWRYVQANGAISQYDCVWIDDDWQAAKITYALTGSNAYPSKAGVAQFAFTDNYYGWVWTSGGGTGSGIYVTCLALCAADVKLYTSATAGAIDDASASQALLQGLKIMVTVGGSTAAAECASAQEITIAC